MPEKIHSSQLSCMTQKLLYVGMTTKKYWKSEVTCMDNARNFMWKSILIPKAQTNAGSIEKENPAINNKGNVVQS